MHIKTVWGGLFASSVLTMGLLFTFTLAGCGLYGERAAIWKTKQELAKRDKDVQELTEVRGKLKRIIEVKLQAARLLESANRVLGRKYMEMGSYNLAEEALRDAEFLKPQNAYIKMDLGECYYFLGVGAVEEEAELRYFALSKQYFLKALELKEDLQEARYGYGLLLFFGYGDASGAIREMKRILDAEPGHVEAHFALGRFYYEQGEMNKAMGEYLTLTRILPKGSPRRKKAEENIELINRELVSQ